MAISGGNPWVTAAGINPKSAAGLLGRLGITSASEGAKKLVSALGGKGGIAGILAFMAAHQVAGGINEYADIKLKREAARMQGRAMTPESLYAEAALPGAMAEAQQARNALLTQLSGGVIGPSLARGERLIGG